MTPGAAVNRYLNMSLSGLRPARRHSSKQDQLLASSLLHNLTHTTATTHVDRIVYRLPEPQRDGRTALSHTLLEFINHLAALIRPPRLHRHRYHDYLWAILLARLVAQETRHSLHPQVNVPRQTPSGTLPNGGLLPASPPLLPVGSHCALAEPYVRC